MPGPGVPDNVPVADRLTPVGSGPVSVKVGVGEPVAVTVNVPFEPTAEVASGSLVITGAEPTIRSKLWMPGPATPLLAVMVTG